MELLINQLNMDVEHHRWEDDDAISVDATAVDDPVELLNKLLSQHIVQGLQTLSEALNGYRGLGFLNANPNNDVHLKELDVRLPDIDADAFLESPSEYFKENLYLALFQAFCRGIDKLNGVQKYQEYRQRLKPESTTIGGSLRDWLQTLKDELAFNAELRYQWQQKLRDTVLSCRVINRLDSSSGEHLLEFCEALYPQLAHKAFIQQLCSSADNRLVRLDVFRQYLQALALHFGGKSTSNASLPEGIIKRLLLQLRLDYLARQRSESTSSLQQALQLLQSDLKKPQEKGWLVAIEQFLDIHMYQGLKVSDLISVQNLHYESTGASTTNSIDHSNERIDYLQPLKMVAKLLQAIRLLSTVVPTDQFQQQLLALSQLVTQSLNGAWASQLHELSQLQQRLASLVASSSSDISWSYQLSNLEKGLKGLVDVIENDESVSTSEHIQLTVETLYENIINNPILQLNAQVQGKPWGVLEQLLKQLLEIFVKESEATSDRINSRKLKTLLLSTALKCMQQVQSWKMELDKVEGSSLSPGDESRIASLNDSRYSSHISVNDSQELAASLSLSPTLSPTLSRTLSLLIYLCSELDTNETSSENYSGLQNKALNLSTTHDGLLINMLLLHVAEDLNQYDQISAREKLKTIFFEHNTNQRRVYLRRWLQRYQLLLSDSSSNFHNNFLDETAGGNVAHGGAFQNEVDQLTGVQNKPVQDKVANNTVAQDKMLYEGVSQKGMAQKESSRLNPEQSESRFERGTKIRDDQHPNDSKNLSPSEKEKIQQIEKSEYSRTNGVDTNNKPNSTIHTSVITNYSFDALQQLMNSDSVAPFTKVNNFHNCLQILYVEFIAECSQLDNIHRSVPCELEQSLLSWSSQLNSIQQDSEQTGKDQVDPAQVDTVQMDNEGQDLHKVRSYQKIKVEDCQSRLEQCQMFLIRIIAFIQHEKQQQSASPVITKRENSLDLLNVDKINTDEINSEQARKRNIFLKASVKTFQRLKQIIDKHYPRLSNILMTKGYCLFTCETTAEESSTVAATAIKSTAAKTITDKLTTAEVTEIATKETPATTTPDQQEQAILAPVTAVIKSPHSYWPLLWPELDRIQTKIPKESISPLIDSNLAAIAHLKEEQKRSTDSLELTRHIELLQTQQSQWQDLQRNYAEDFIADDGGMLLFWPMLTELFKRCELLEQPEGEKSWQFIDDQARYKARSLLVYVYKGEEQEGDDCVYGVINILLGLPPETLVMESDVLSDTERAAADGMMQALIQKWTALRSMSARGLRQQFLERQARCQSVELGYEVIVDKKTIDILLSQLPWGIGMISLPWLGKELIRVDWGGS